jgi:hypothetical protein
MTVQNLREEIDLECVSVDVFMEAMPILVRQGETYPGLDRKTLTRLDRWEWHDHSGPGGKLRIESRK